MDLIFVRGDAATVTYGSDEMDCRIVHRQSGRVFVEWEDGTQYAVDLGDLQRVFMFTASPRKGYQFEISDWRLVINAAEAASIKAIGEGGEGL